MAKKTKSPRDSSGVAKNGGADDSTEYIIQTVSE